MDRPGLTLTRRSPWTLAVVLAALGGCDHFLVPGPNGCDSTHPCQRPERPHCEEETGACLPLAAMVGPPCREHADCESGVCDEFGAAVSLSGHCLPGPAVIQVSDASALFAALTTHAGIRLAPGTYKGDWRISAGGVVLAGPRALGKRGDPPAVLESARPDGAALSVTDGARVALDGVVVRGNRLSGPGVFCESPSGRVWLRRAEIRGHGGRGVWARCPLLITQSTIGGADASEGNQGGGVLAESDVSLTNSFISFNGTIGSSLGGVALTAAPGARPMRLLAYLSFVRNQAGVAGGAIGCGGGDMVEVWASLLWQNQTGVEPVSDRCLIRSAAVDDTRIDVYGTTLFMDKDHPPAFRGVGDFHLTAGSGPRDAVPLGEGPPIMSDYDGDVRPSGGGRDYGADEFVP